MLKILQLADIHGAVSLITKIQQEICQADVVVLCGDITHFGGRAEVREIIDSIAFNNKNILAVAGNCDQPVVDEYLDGAGIGIDRKIICRHNFQWAGLSGSLPCPGHTPLEFTEREYEERLRRIEKALVVSLPLILTIHQPPLHTCNDLLTDGTHVGSQAVRNFIERISPMLCLTAHIHEGVGTDIIGGCTVVNPGPFRNGRYALIETDGEKSVNVALRQITA